MNKKELVKKVAKSCKLSQAVCERVLDSFADEVKECLVSGDNLSWYNFVVIETYERKPIRRRDPITNGVTTFPAAKTIRCTFSKTIKDAIKENERKKK